MERAIRTRIHCPFSFGHYTRVAMVCLTVLMAVWTLGNLGRFVVANPPPPIFPPYEQSTGRLGAVACSDARCTRIGLDALRKGGNAADAVSLLADSLYW